MEGLSTKRPMRFWASLWFAASAVKLLLVPAYKSTDFEVHRNWLSITHSLPVTEWYHDATSRWTLDYPPLFAVFEWALSLVVPFVDRNALSVSSTPYESWPFLVFHRASVVVADGVLLVGLARLAAAVVTQRTFLGDPIASQRILVSILFLHPGLLIVDHVHFQYNGFLIGVLCIACAFLCQVC